MNDAYFMIILYQEKVRFSVNEEFKIAKYINVILEVMYCIECFANNLSSHAKYCFNEFQFNSFRPSDTYMYMHLWTR